MAAAFWPHHGARPYPAELRHIEFGRGLRTGQRKFGLRGLQVWGVDTGVAFPEVGRLSAVVARGERLLILPDTVESGMVLKVLTDTGQMLHDGDAVSLQSGPVADTGLHQHLGGVDRAQGEHHLGSRADAVGLAVMGELHAGDSVALVLVEREPGHQRAGENRQVWPVHEGENVGTEYGLAVSVTGSQIKDRRAAVALHHAAVL